MDYDKDEHDSFEHSRMAVKELCKYLPLEALQKVFDFVGKQTGMDVGCMMSFKEALFELQPDKLLKLLADLAKQVQMKE